MNKEKANAKGAAPVQAKLREFPPWPLEPVMEVARMLYASAPFNCDLWSHKHRWTSLARQASDFLDHLHEGCEEIARQRRGMHNAYRRAEARALKAETLPDVVPFAKAARTITNERRTDRALKNLKTLVLKNPRYFGGLFGNPPTTRRVNTMIARWRKTGFPRSEVMELQRLFEDSWPGIIAAQNSEKTRKRKPRLNPKDKPLIGAVLNELRAD